MATHENPHYTSNEGAKSSRLSTPTLSEQSHRVIEDVKELGHTALTTAGEAAGQLREKGAAAFEAGKEKASAAKGQFDKVVGENPMKSVLIALGVGALIGYALRRR